MRRSLSVITTYKKNPLRNTVDNFQIHLIIVFRRIINIGNTNTIVVYIIVIIIYNSNTIIYNEKNNIGI